MKEKLQLIGFIILLTSCTWIESVVELILD